jgi:hypothetical protein
MSEEKLIEEFFLNSPEKLWKELFTEKLTPHFSKSCGGQGYEVYLAKDANHPFTKEDDPYSFYIENNKVRIFMNYTGGEKWLVKFMQGEQCFKFEGTDHAEIEFKNFFVHDDKVGWMNQIREFLENSKIGINSQFFTQKNP